MQKAEVFPSQHASGPVDLWGERGTENRQETCSKNHTEKTLLTDLWLLFSALPLANLWLDTLFHTNAGFSALS